MADYAIHEETLVDISNVIRKKDGTSALIDPADYADRINLMGMLEEKTVSSSTIVTFSDGADAVPLKKCEITLPASLDGYSEIDVIHARKNLVDYGEREEMVRNGITSSISADGTITASGTSTGNGDTIITLSTSMFLKSGQPYTISFTGTDTRSGSIYIYFTGGGYINIPNSRSYGVYTPTSDVTITGITLRMFNGNSITMSARMMIEAGNVSDISYEPYTAPTTHTADLGRTIHGGSVDVVAGEGVDENDNPFTFDPVPIDSKLGNNTIWSEQGSSAEVTYRGQGTVTVYPNAEEASF